jgi:hypothetical protein
MPTPSSGDCKIDSNESDKNQVLANMMKTVADTGCGHAEVGINSLELGVGMQRWGSTALNWVWACRGGVDSLELGVGMQRWGSTALNWVWACRGGVDSLVDPTHMCRHHFELMLSLDESQAPNEVQDLLIPGGPPVNDLNHRCVVAPGHDCSALPIRPPDGCCHDDRDQLLPVSYQRLNSILAKVQELQTSMCVFVCV